MVIRYKQFRLPLRQPNNRPYVGIIGNDASIFVECLGWWIILEAHIDCRCSYCRERGRRRLGLLLPEDKSRSSWRIFYFPWFGGYTFYLRSTLIELGRLFRSKK